jgi:hypothetical protein
MRPRLQHVGRLPLADERFLFQLAGLRKALLEYCRQATLGLVRLLDKMREMDMAEPSVPADLAKRRKGMLE